MGKAKQQISFLKVDKDQFEEEKREALKSCAAAEIEVKTLTDGQAAAQQAKSSREADAQQLQKSIKEHEQQLAKLTPQYDNQFQQETSIKSQLDSAESGRRRLDEKQGRNAHFRDKKERDAHLRDQINAGYPQLGKIKAVRLQNNEDIVGLEKEVASLTTDIGSLRDQIEGRSDDQAQKDIDKVRGERDQLTDERKELWREEAKLNSVISNASEELRRAEQELSHTMDHNTSRGVASMRRIKRQHNIQGAYGMLAELMTVDNTYRRAVEASAGQSLFHYIVDTDDTASKLIDILQKERGGRLTFVPLNRMKPRTANLPKSNDAISMLSRLKYDDKYENAFQQVFANTVICEDLTIAGQYARSHGVNGVTLDGDRSDNKGAFTGGSADNKHSRLQAVRNVSRLRDEYDSHTSRSTEIRRQLEHKDQEITQAVGNLRRLEQRLQQKENSYGPLRQELRSKTALLENKQDSLDAKRQAKSNIEASYTSLDEQQTALQAEIDSEFKTTLTKDEQDQLETLRTTVLDLGKQYFKLSSLRSETESRKSLLEIELRENLKPRLESLQAADNNSSEGNRGNLKRTKAELERLQALLSHVEAKLEETDNAIETTSSTIADLVSRRAAVMNSQSELAREIEKAQRGVEKSIQKRRILSQRAQEVTQRIRDLGILPQGALEKYEKVKSEQVIKRLHKVNDALKKYGHVNKKAFEQYQNFTNQRDTLTKRREELDSSQASIEELIQVLDQRKDEAIERTFKQVSREFANVFGKLVPAGRGRLIIQRRADRAAGGEEDSDEEAGQRSSVENYTGVGITVSFNSKHDDQQRIQQLSGGQKSEFIAYSLVPIPYTKPLYRALRPRPRLRHPTMRSRTLLPLRRNRRQPRRPIPHRRRTDAAIDLGTAVYTTVDAGRRGQQQCRRRSIHLHNVPSGNAACGGEVLRGEVSGEQE